MSFTQSIVALAHQHPSLVSLIVFFCAMAEAVIVIGAFVPGSVFIILLAGVVGAARGRVWPLVVAAIAGSAIADAVSYWIGRRYRLTLRNLWPFSKRPDLFDRGARFFERHGGKSVLVGRFLPGLRAIIPVAAGALGMPPPLFFAANIASAVSWSIIHIVPAAGAGVVLSVVGRISGRLVGAVLLFLVLLALALYAARLAALVVVPRLIALYERAIANLSRAENPHLRQVGAWLDPARADLRAHIVWGVVLLASVIGLTAIIRGLVNGEVLAHADAAISTLAQSLRTPPIDHVMVVIAAFGDRTPIVAAVAILLTTLLASGARRAAALVATVFIATAVFIPVFQFAFRQQVAASLYPGLDGFTFPSSPATFATLLCGVIAVLATRHLPVSGRIAAWTGAVVGAAMIGIARIYLNAHWPSDIFGGLLLGLAVTTVFALIFKDFEAEVEKSIRVPLIALLGFLAVGGVAAWTGFDASLGRYAPKTKVEEIAAADWLAAGWRALPGRRSELFGETEESLFVQVAADPDALAAALSASGWRRAEAFGPADLLFFLVPTGELQSFPPLPLMQGGRLPALTLTHADPAPERRLVLRLWPSDFAATSTQGSRPILVGSLTEERIAHPYEALTILSDRPVGESALAVARQALTDLGGAFAVSQQSGREGPILLVSTP